MHRLSWSISDASAHDISGVSPPICWMTALFACHSFARGGLLHTIQVSAHAPLPTAWASKQVLLMLVISGNASKIKKKKLKVYFAQLPSENSEYLQAWICLQSIWANRCGQQIPAGRQQWAAEQAATSPITSRIPSPLLTCAATTHSYKPTLLHMVRNWKHVHTVQPGDNIWTSWDVTVCLEASSMLIRCSFWGWKLASFTR